ncbi:hypothetical protein EYV94_23040 [Puteibacter caeruleilacunae]|nr:hypothetical protein EYV94_23040 [Puteibacter caeruleilacunae]
MDLDRLQGEVLGMIRTVFTDYEKLERVHKFLKDEIYEEVKIEIPKKYKKTVHYIADSLQAGEICYFNPDTLEVEEVPEKLVNDPYEFEMVTGCGLENWDLKNEEWERCIQVDPMHSSDSYKIMERFIDQIGDKRFQEKLTNAINRRKPFANFRYLIDDSDYLQDWYDYKQEQYELYVWDIIEESLED